MCRQLRNLCRLISLKLSHTDWGNGSKTFRLPAGTCRVLHPNWGQISSAAFRQNEGDVSRKSARKVVGTADFPLLCSHVGVPLCQPPQEPEGLFSEEVIFTLFNLDLISLFLHLLLNEVMLNTSDFIKTKKKFQFI